MSSQKLSGTLKNPSASGKKPSLLVVEDNAALAENLYEFLGSENSTIVRASQLADCNPDQ